MRIALVVPPGYSVPHAQFCLERLGLGYLAAPLRADGHEVEIVDGLLEGLTWEEVLQRLGNRRPGLMGVSLMSHHGYDQTVLRLRQLRRDLPDAHLCLGGMFPSLNAQPLLAALPEVDSIALGEGEHTVCELARRLQEGRSLEGVPGLCRRSPSGLLQERPPVSPVDLDLLPRPARDQIRFVLGRSGPATLITSRGCYSRCTFCTIEAVTRSLYSQVVRYRSPADVASEIEELVHAYGARKLYFVDENFMVGGERGRRRAREIAREILRRRLDVRFSLECRCMDVEEETFARLVEAGLQRVFLGVESIDPDELDRFRKAQSPAMVEQAITILRRLGVHVEIGFILFTPWSTLETLRRKRDFLECFGSAATASLGSYLSVMPGTALEGQLRGEGLLRGEWPGYWFDFADRRAAILFGLVQRELTDPWAEVLQRLLGYQWNRPLDWSLGHAQRRAPDPEIDFLQELLDWVARVRLAHFDALLAQVENLQFPEDADHPPASALAALRGIGEASRRDAADALALLAAFEEAVRPPTSLALAG